jgi:hypothetical protein
MSARNENDLVELRISLEKAISESQSDEEILDRINALKNIPITIEVLRKTKIGQSLQGFYHAFDTIAII